MGIVNLEAQWVEVVVKVMQRWAQRWKGPNALYVPHPDPFSDQLHCYYFVPWGFIVSLQKFSPPTPLFFFGLPWVGFCNLQPKTLSKTHNILASWQNIGLDFVFFPVWLLNIVLLLHGLGVPFIWTLSRSDVQLAQWWLWTAILWPLFTRQLSSVAGIRRKA